MTGDVFFYQTFEGNIVGADCISVSKASRVQEREIPGGRFRGKAVTKGAYEPGWLVDAAAGALHCYRLTVLN
jgi:hypothetical protein